jgi:hypothetical protein
MSRRLNPQGRILSVLVSELECASGKVFIHRKRKTVTVVFGGLRVISTDYSTKAAETELSLIDFGLSVLPFAVLLVG